MFTHRLRSKTHHGGEKATTEYLTTGWFLCRRTRRYGYTKWLKRFFVLPHDGPLYCYQSDSVFRDDSKNYEFIVELVGVVWRDHSGRHKNNGIPYSSLYSVITKHDVLQLMIRSTVELLHWRRHIEQAIKIAFKQNKDQMAKVTVSPEEALGIKKNKMRAEKREQDMREREGGFLCWATTSFLSSRRGL